MGSTMHADLDQKARERVMREFRSVRSAPCWASSRGHVLVSTDLLASGIDVQQASLVINYDLPQNMGDYLQRIGRIGRLGRKGVVLNFVTPSDMRAMKDIVKFYRTQIDEMPMDMDIADLMPLEVSRCSR